MNILKTCLLEKISSSWWWLLWFSALSRSETSTGLNLTLSFLSFCSQLALFSLAGFTDVDVDVEEDDDDDEEEEEDDEEDDDEDNDMDATDETLSRQRFGSTKLSE